MNMTQILIETSQSSLSADKIGNEDEMHLCMPSHPALWHFKLESARAHYCVDMHVCVQCEKCAYVYVCTLVKSVCNINQKKKKLC